MDAGTSMEPSQFLLDVGAGLRLNGDITCFCV